MMSKTHGVRLLLFTLVQDWVLAVGISNESFISFQSEIDTAVEVGLLNCYEYRIRTQYLIQCAAMCLTPGSPEWDDDFLISQDDCILFAYNESSSLDTNCVLCFPLNTGETYQVNVSNIVADHGYYSSDVGHGRHSILL